MLVRSIASPSRLPAWLAALALLAAPAGAPAGPDRPPDAGADAEAEREAGTDEPADLLFVTAAAVHAGDGSVHRPGRLLIEDGRVKALGSDLEAPEGARRWDFPSAVITPGLIEPAARVALEGSEARGALSTAALTAADARDPWDPWLERLRSSGLVAAALHPASSGTFHGRVATIGTSGPGASGAPLLAEAAALAVSLETDRPGSPARAQARRQLDEELEKTEKYGADWKAWREQEKADEGKSPAELRREERRRAKKKKKGAGDRVKKPGRDEGREVLLEVLAKKLPLRIEADRSESVDEALRLARRRELSVTLTGCLECASRAEELGESRAVVLLAPLRLPLDEGPRGEPEAGLPEALEAADVRIAVSGGGAWPEGALWLRLAAADLVRRGLSPERAVAAMTGEAAAAAGLGGSHGRLAPGRDAEFVVWSADPLSMSARVERLVSPDETRLAPADEESGDDGEEVS